jgi:hypothetical protein
MSRNSERSFTADSERISKDFMIDNVNVVKNFLWSEQSMSIETAKYSRH